MRGRLLKSGRLSLDDYLKFRYIRDPCDFDRFDVPNYVLSSIINQRIVEYVKGKRYNPDVVAMEGER